MKYASFGSISSGTLRTEDLLDAFADELEYQVQQNAEHWCSDTGRAERDRLMALIGDAREIDLENGEDNPDEIVDELQDELSAFAPPCAYFGAHEGNGTDFGYWLSPNMLDADGFDGLRVDDTSEVPADYTGEVLHVTDHGNVTLYTAHNGELTEVWALV